MKRQRSYIMGAAGITIVLTLLLVLGGLGSVSASPMLQATATSTNTPTATQTPTNTPTPIATPLSLLASTSAQVQSVRCGAYGLPVTAGDCFQALAGGGISVYGATGNVVFHVDGATASTNTGFMGAGSNQFMQCGTTNVTGSANVTPVAGLTPVSLHTSLEAITGDAARVAGITSGGLITLTVRNSALTPAANTTAAAVDWCIIGTK